MNVRIKRADLLPGAEDGTRVLVDRYWPRALRGGEERIDAWVREVAPSPRLTAWYGRRIERWDEFVVRYREELQTVEARRALDRLRLDAYAGGITLLHGSRDADHTPARALADVLAELPPIPTGMMVTSYRRPVAFDAPSGAIPWRPNVELLDWGWLLFGLGAPIMSFAFLAVIGIYGARGLVGVLLALTTLCLVTFAYGTLRESGSELAFPASSQDSEPIWKGVAHLALVAAGTVAGIVALFLVLGLLALHGGLAR